jgi:hypothetical protein
MFWLRQAKLEVPPQKALASDDESHGFQSALNGAVSGAAEWGLGISQ